MGQNGQSPYLRFDQGTGSKWLTNNGTYGPVNCWNNPNYVCSSSMGENRPDSVRPAAAYYDTNNNLVGPQPNPFGLVSTSLYADPAHAGQWATRTVNDTQEWGTFSQAVTLFGQTEYKYVKQY